MGKLEEHRKICYDRVFSALKYTSWMTIERIRLEILVLSDANIQYTSQFIKELLDEMVENGVVIKRDNYPWDTSYKRAGFIYKVLNKSILKGRHHV